MTNFVAKFFITNMAKKFPLILSITALVIFAIGVGWWQYLSPPIHDDIPYRYFCLTTDQLDFWEIEGEPITTFTDAVVSGFNNWLMINGRLANCMLSAILLLPEWLLAILHTMMAGIAIFFMLFLGLGKKGLKCSWVCAILPLAVWKFLPWQDNFCSDSFYINYIWSAAFVLAFLWLILHPDWLQKRSMQVFAAIFSFIAGFMHEGFSVPVLAGVGAMLIFPKSCLCKEEWGAYWRKQIIFPVVAFAVGAFLAVFAPSTFSRGVREDVFTSSVSWLSVIKFVLFRIQPLYIYLLLCAAIWWRHGWSSLKRNLKKQSLFIIIALASIALPILIRRGEGRLMCFPNVMLIILCLQMLGGLCRLSERPRKGLAVLLIAVQLLFLQQLLTFQARVGKEMNEFTKSFYARADGTGFVSPTRFADYPWWLFNMVHSPFVDIHYYTFMIKTLPQFKWQKNISTLILPDSLPDPVKFEDVEKIPGNNPFRGFYPLFLTKEPVEEGQEIEIALDISEKNVNPLRRAFLKEMKVKAEVKKYRMVPGFLPDTVYAVVLTNPASCLGRHKIMSMNVLDE